MCNMAAVGVDGPTAEIRKPFCYEEKLRGEWLK
jgi:hypothetical protein